MNSIDLSTDIRSKIHQGIKNIDYRNELITDEYPVTLNFEESISIRFFECTFSNATYLKASSQQTTIRFIDCNIEKLVVENLMGGSIWIFGKKGNMETIEFINSNCDIHFEKANVSDVRFYNYEVSNQFVRANDSFFENLEIHNARHTDGEYNFTQLEVSQLLLSGKIFVPISFDIISNLSKVRFDRLKVKDELILDHLYSSENPEKFQISSSNLNGVKIQNSELGKMGLVVSDSDISEMFTSNTKFANVKSTDNPFRDKETCRQLKKAAENNHNKIEARGYGADELEHYWRHLKKENKSIWHRLPLWISKWTNDFGRSWQLAFWSLTGWSVLFYTLIGVFQSDNISTYFDFLLSGTFFQFLFPLHSLDSIVRIDIGEYEILIGSIDILPLLLASVAFLQRIFSGFYIYQLIRAFRFHYNT